MQNTTFTKQQLILPSLPCLVFCEFCELNCHIGSVFFNLHYLPFRKEAPRGGQFSRSFHYFKTNQRKTTETESGFSVVRGTCKRWGVEQWKIIPGWELELYLLKQNVISWLEFFKVVNIHCMNYFYEMIDI